MKRFVSKGRMFFLGCLCSTLLGLGTLAQEMPADYQEVLKSLGRTTAFWGHQFQSGSRRARQGQSVEHDAALATGEF